MKKSRKIILGVGISLLLLIIWGLIEPYTISVENEKAVIPGLPEEWAGEKIAVIADFQIGMWMDNDSVVSKAVDEILEIEPKVVLILGDFVYHPNDDHQMQMESVIDYLRPLTDENLKVYAVLGNHDYALGSKEDQIKHETAERVSSKLEEIGVDVLNNESVALTLQDGNIRNAEDSDDALYIAGIGSNWAKDDDVEKTFRSFPEDAPRFVMMHNPRTFTLIPRDKAPVAVAGHTHGGQFRLPFSSQFSYMDLRSEEEIPVDGWIDEDYRDNDNRLYVNRGIGLSLIPMRINCPPEITVFTLEAP